MTARPLARTAPATADGAATPADPHDDPPQRDDPHDNRDDPHDNGDDRRRPGSGEWGWSLALVPAFPLTLLVLRVWYLSRQDLQTMLLVLQAANPLGLMSALLINLIWAVPAVILLLRTFYLLLRVSADDGGRSSWLWRLGRRTPIWVVAPAIVLALLSWQLRFLPTWLMLSLAIAGLEVKVRGRSGPLAVAVTCTALPVMAGLAALVWFAPAIVEALLTTGESVTAILLLVPPLAAPALIGPLPPSVARRLLPTLAAVLSVAAPLLFANSYLNAPVLPRFAVVLAETEAADSPTTVVRGDLVSVDDQFTTLLLTDGRVVSLPGGERIRARVLCSERPEPPTSSVDVRGWQVEQSVLSWAAPRPLQIAPDPRCRGR